VCENKTLKEISVVAHTLVHRILPFTDPDNWSPHTWRRHLVSTSSVQADRDELMGYFVD